MLNREKYGNSRVKMQEWDALRRHAQDIAQDKIQNLFASDPKRFDAFHADFDGMMLDYSKQKMTDRTITLLMDLVRVCGFEELREMLFTGGILNTTENRASLHTALRAPETDVLTVDGEDIMPRIHETLRRMKALTEQIHAEKQFTRIVNIGIGGSDLGSFMVCEALKPFKHTGVDVHFVSNVDATHLCEALRGADPNKTLFIVTSKTFTTQETMTNARSAQDWLRVTLGRDDVSAHFIAVTSNHEGAKSFGMHAEQIFPIWDWVGGRFSLWSAIGLSICLAIGFDNFKAMLDGAHAMDTHFKNVPLEKNLPVLLAVTGIWNRNFLGYDTLSVLPYDQYLHRFPAYIQQLDMESNGKNVTRDGQKITDYHTGPVVFGEPGTNAQHAFFQLIHQGTMIIPCEFITCRTTHNPLGDHYQKLMSNALGQAKALMDGRTHECLHRTFDGNRPSTMLLLDQLDPYRLGMLLALYEHKIFVQGAIWDINSFDQWGVELGKELAGQVLQHFEKHDHSQDLLDSSTQGLVDRLLKS